MPLKSYSGRCHCGAVQYEAKADLEAGTYRCNCSICSMTRMWLVFVATDDFRLFSGEDRLGDYRFGAGRVRHRFCTVCGVKPFGMTTDGSGVALNIACLGGIAPEQRAALPVAYLDGAQDRFDTAPSVTSHL